MPEDQKQGSQHGSARIEPIFDASGALRRATSGKPAQMEASVPATPLRNRLTNDHQS